MLRLTCVKTRPPLTVRLVSPFVSCTRQTGLVIEPVQFLLMRSAETPSCVGPRYCVHSTARAGSTWSRTPSVSQRHVAAGRKPVGRPALIRVVRQCLNWPELQGAGRSRELYRWRKSRRAEPMFGQSPDSHRLVRAGLGKQFSVDRRGLAVKYLGGA